MLNTVLTLIGPYIVPTVVAAALYIWVHLPLKRQQELTNRTAYLRGLMLDIVTTVQKTSEGASGADKAAMAKGLFKEVVNDLNVHGVPTSLVDALIEPAVATMKSLLAPAPAPATPSDTTPPTPVA